MTIAVALLSLALASSSSERHQAKRLFERASAEYEQQDFEAALRDFQAAYRLAAVPEILFNLGQCHFELHRFRRAAFYYRRYLEARPHAANAEQVRARLAELDRAEARAALAETPPPPKPKPPPKVLPKVPPTAVSPPTIVRKAEPPGPTHALSLTLAGASAVAAVMGAYGILRVANYVQLANGNNAALQTYGHVSQSDYQQQAATYVNAQHWEIGAAALLLATVGGVVGAVVTW
ncbi:MAG TPA: tetratricopeptide repeat protein [Myxococcales bacterium]|nr:tetratricopeptide repeat protein [Myxococcales bacterium]